MNNDYIEPETNNVIGVQFSIMGPEEIRKRSVVEINKHETYEKDNPVIKITLIVPDILVMLN